MGIFVLNLSQAGFQRNLDPMGQDPLPRGLLSYKGQWHNRANLPAGPLN